MSSRGFALSICGLAILLTGCTSTSPDDRSSGSADQVDHPIETADSKPAELGEPYRFVVSTHCGIDWAIDFDGSFWNPTREDMRTYRRGGYRALREPSDRGTMTLRSEDQTIYRSNSGPVIRYTRGGTNRPDTPCL